MIRMENRSSGHNKFYELYQSGTNVNVRYGKIDTAGTILTKKFHSVDDASEWINKQRWEKDASGYSIIDAHVSAATVSYYKDRIETLQKSRDYYSGLYFDVSSKLSKAREAIK